MDIARISPECDCDRGPRARIGALNGGLQCFKSRIFNGAAHRESQVGTIARWSQCQGFNLLSPRIAQNTAMSIFTTQGLFSDPLHAFLAAAIKASKARHLSGNLTLGTETPKILLGEDPLAA
ncbi:hypothetical protein AWB74_08599 [Caballeronia arvi]|uniref:Uncharacterized protein n=2 Tax=Caballeronia arvi TaxID=1777135 RepID=A0A158L501_9BURK|nr:hypothetical protein AWB74_08599 [Caballeronia arvi]